MNFVNQIAILVQGQQHTVPRFAAGMTVYRGRTCDEGKLTNVSEITYPRKEYAQSDQRANRAGAPLFYCAAARNAPFSELDLESGQHLVLSHWETQEEITLTHLGYTPETLRELGAQRECPPYAFLEDPACETCVRVRSYFTQEFSRKVTPGQEYLYKVSIAIAERHLNSDLLNGLLYPTVAMMGNTENMAIKTTFVDDHLAFRKAEYIRVDKREGQRRSISVLDTADELDAQGTILWKGRRDQWVIRKDGGQLTFVNRNGIWEAHDEDGNLVRPE